MNEYREQLLDLEKRSGPNALSPLGNPLLLDWITIGDEQAAIRLLNNGAIPDSKGSGGEYPLQLAVDKDMADAVQLLLSLGADTEVECAGCPTPLYRASRDGKDSLVRILLSGPCQVDRASFANETPLMAACESGHLSTVELLLKHGADLNSVSASGWTPLIHAGIGGHSQIAKCLLEHDANPSIRDQNGYNATDWARIKHDVMVAEGFRELGIPDIYTLDENVSTDSVPNESYDIFVSYKQMHFSDAADSLRSHLIEAGKKVFVDRYELKLDPCLTTDNEVLKVKLARVLKSVKLTIFFEIYWDGTHGEPQLNLNQLNWQMFELLHSRRAVLIAHERMRCDPFIMIPGSKLDTATGFSYQDYQSLSQSILTNYFDGI